MIGAFCTCGACNWWRYETRGFFVGYGYCFKPNKPKTTAIWMQPIAYFDDFKPLPALGYMYELEVKP